MLEMPAMTGRLDQVPGGRVDIGNVGARHGCGHPGQLSRRHELVDLTLPGPRLPQRHGPGHVRVITLVPGTAVDGDEVTPLELATAGRVVRDRAIGPAGD